MGSLIVLQVPATDEKDLTYELVAFRKISEVRSRMNFSLTWSNLLRSPTLGPDFDSLMCGDDDPSGEFAFDSQGRRNSSSIRTIKKSLLISSRISLSLKA